MKFVSILAALILVISATSQAQSSNVEVVQSVPIETTLAVPGIRQTQAVWIEMIQAAKQTIDLEQFYISNKAGESLEPVINALKDAGARGVKIRFMIDSSFLKSNPDEAKPLNGIANLQLKQITFASLGGIQHAKYIVVDQNNIFVGSANFDWLALSHIHEVGMHIKDLNMAADLESIFNLDWNSSWASVVTLDGAYSTRPSLFKRIAAFFRHRQPGKPQDNFTLLASPAVVNPTGIPATIDAITSMIASAKETLKIQVYEYALKDFSPSTWTVLDEAIRKAAASGVKVQFLLDSVTLKSGGTALKALAQLPNIEVRTVVIPQWSGGPLAYARLIHSKYMMVDHATAWVGSENWSQNYFMGTRNVGILVQSVSVTNQLEQIFNQVWTSAYTTKM